MPWRPLAEVAGRLTGKTSSGVA